MAKHELITLTTEAGDVPAIVTAQYDDAGDETTLDGDVTSFDAVVIGAGANSLRTGIDVGTQPSHAQFAEPPLSLQLALHPVDLPDETGVFFTYKSANIARNIGGFVDESSDTNEINLSTSGTYSTLISATVPDVDYSYISVFINADIDGTGNSDMIINPIPVAATGQGFTIVVFNFTFTKITNNPGVLKVGLQQKSGATRAILGGALGFVKVADYD